MTLQLTGSTIPLLCKLGSSRRGSKYFLDAYKDRVSDTTSANHPCEEPQLKVSVRADRIVVAVTQCTKQFLLSLPVALALLFPGFKNHVNNTQTQHGQMPFVVRWFIV